MLSVAASTHDAVNLINEDSAWLVVPCQFKQNPDKLLTVTSPLGHDCACRNIKKGSTAFSSDCLRKHRLASTRWAKQQNTLPWLQNALEKVGIPHGHENCFFQKTLCVFEAHNVFKPNSWVLVDDFILNCHC